jgi:chlorite dismutase
MQPAETQQQPTLDIRERGGAKNGQPQFLDRRLFLQFLAFGGAKSLDPLKKQLEASGLESVLYEDLNDPRGVGLLLMSEDPADFLKARPMLNDGAFGGLTAKPEYTMLGRTYALGYEPNLEDWLLQRTKRVVFDAATPWAVWYPLRRTGAFSTLSHQEQGQILKEHGQIGRQYGDAGLASDVRLACAGLDKNDNDFVIGLIGKELYPLSALVQAMRVTKQTSTYIQNLGPFFVGRLAWKSK